MTKNSTSVIYFITVCELHGIVSLYVHIVRGICALICVANKRMN